MLDKWQYLWNQYSDQAMMKCSNGEISEEEMEYMLDVGESSCDYEDLIKSAKIFDIKLRKSW